MVFCSESLLNCSFFPLLEEFLHKCSLSEFIFRGLFFLKEKIKIKSLRIFLCRLNV